MNAKMLARDLNGDRFACGCCQNYSHSGRGKKKGRRTARRRERGMFREGFAGRWEI